MFVLLYGYRSDVYMDNHKKGIFSMVEMPTPKESNVYSKVICRPVCDSFGVEPGYERSIFNKHAIPLGLAWQRSYQFIVLHSKKDEGLFSQVPLVASGNYHLIPTLIPLSLTGVTVQMNKGIRFEGGCVNRFSLY